MTIYFYVEREKPYGCFSNFSAHGFMLDELYWATSEHYFQAQKFVDTLYLEKVRQTKTPKDAANMGRNRSLPLRSGWEQVKMMSCGRLYYKSSEPMQTFEKSCWQLGMKC
jgi:ribA/ribD-fused uncharacterized protein